PLFHLLPLLEQDRGERAVDLRPDRHRHLRYCVPESVQEHGNVSLGRARDHHWGRAGAALSPGGAPEPPKVALRVRAKMMAPPSASSNVPAKIQRVALGCSTRPGATSEVMIHFRIAG